LQQEFPELSKRYWGQTIDFCCWSLDNITDEMVKKYLEHHRNPTNNEDSNFILEISLFQFFPTFKV
jgi:putative transposase